ncbi:MAG TPA: indole-3-glycerol phosphate synthase TrpC [Gemmatimonadales bacterium]
MPVTLDQILASTSRGLEPLRARRAELERVAGAAGPVPSFERALRGPRVAVIAEVKRRSPSAGSIREDLDPSERAGLYARRGAAAVSVLTDGPFFGGSVDDLRAACEAVQRVEGVSPVPVLRKDFILDEVQILEARGAGASAVLLIVRALAPARLRSLLAAVTGWGIEALVEVHTAAEVDVALEAGARVIGVNSRDLDTFRVDAATAWRLLELVPADRSAVAESGMAAAADVESAGAAGADAVLVGSALSAARDPGGLLEAMSRVPRRGR